MKDIGKEKILGQISIEDLKKMIKKYEKLGADECFISRDENETWYYNIIEFYKK